MQAQNASENQQRLKEVRTQIERTENTIQQAETESQGIQVDLKQAEKEISFIRRRLRIIRKDYDLQEARWRELQIVKVAREQALETEQQRLENCSGRPTRWSGMAMFDYF